jgi:hypothetical protein
MLSITSPAQEKLSFAHRSLSASMTLGILFLVACNGFFTYSGAKLYINEELYALLFAIAVQFAIATALITLPSVRGLGRLVLLFVYIAALALSTLSAFTYIYDSSLSEGKGTHALETRLKVSITNQLSEAFRAEQSFVNEQRQNLMKLERMTTEEESRGYKSGKGPGKGLRYYEKLETFENERTHFEDVQARFADATIIYNKINQSLSQPAGNQQRDELIVLLSQLRAHSHSLAAKKILTEVNQQSLGQVVNPVERAVKALGDYNNYSVNVVVSAVWAAIFDLLALFIGIIRYYLVKPYNSLAKRFHESLLEFATLFMRFGNIGSDANIKYQQMAIDAQEPINSAEMQKFATYLLAGGQLSLQNGEEDPIEPLRIIGRHIEPLGLDKPKNSVGIPHENLHNEYHLKTLIAMLVQTGVFLNDLNNECYILNSSPDMAQKVLVFIRIGMKDQPGNLENVSFLEEEKSAPVLSIY